MSEQRKSQACTEVDGAEDVAFGPAQAAVQQYLATFKEWPPKTPEIQPDNTGGVGN